MNRQDSLTDQMLDLAVIARRTGMYDAEDYIRQAFPREGAPAKIVPVRPDICGLPGRNGICIKPPKHGQRHRYGKTPPKPHVIPERSWKKITEWKPEGARFALVVGNPCKVTGQRGEWKIIAMERHVFDPLKINVEVTNDRTGHGRIFSIDKIQYRRPKKVS